MNPIQSTDEVEAALSNPVNIAIEDYSIKVQEVLRNRNVSSLPKIHLAIAKGYHDLNEFNFGIRYAEGAILLANKMRDTNGIDKIIEWAYLVKIECLRKLNRRCTELRVLHEYNRIYGNRRDFLDQEAQLLRLYNSRIQEFISILFPSTIVLVVGLHWFFGCFDEPVSYVMILSFLIIISIWTNFYGHSFRNICSRFLQLVLWLAPRSRQCSRP